MVRPSKLLVVFDWDGVIFDTMPMRKIRNKLLKELGYSEDHITSTARRAVESGGGYNFHSHAKLLARRSLRHNPQTLAKMIYDEVEKHPSTFIFPDARRTIASLKRAKYNFDILTAGHVDFQEYKMVRSGLRSLFRNVHIVRPGPRTPHHKLAVLKKLALSHTRVIFLDDRADTIETVHRSPELKGKVLPILVWREKTKFPKGLVSLRSLSWREIQKIAIHNGFRP